MTFTTKNYIGIDNFVIEEYKGFEIFIDNSYSNMVALRKKGVTLWKETEYFHHYNNVKEHADNLIRLDISRYDLLVGETIIFLSDVCKILRYDYINHGYTVENKNGKKLCANPFYVFKIEK